MLRKDDGRQLEIRLSRVQRRFDDWRRSRSLGTRIPQALWQEAVQLAMILGVHRTAASLRLDYYSLQKRVRHQAADQRQREANVARSPRPAQSRLADSRPADSSARGNSGQPTVEVGGAPGLPGFVEWISPRFVAARQVLIEFDTGRGTRLRVQLGGSQVTDVIALGRGLCFGETGREEADPPAPKGERAP